VIKQHLTALLHRERCDRATLIPMLDKLNEQERRALWRLIQNVQDDARREGVRKGAPQPWRRF
jgi:hypothetical protein